MTGRPIKKPMQWMPNSHRILDRPSKRWVKFLVSSQAHETRVKPARRVQHRKKTLTPDALPLHAAAEAATTGRSIQRQDELLYEVDPRVRCVPPTRGASHPEDVVGRYRCALTSRASSQQPRNFSRITAQCAGWWQGKSV